jgi:hypothetical protein
MEKLHLVYIGSGVFQNILIHFINHSYHVPPAFSQEATTNFNLLLSSLSFVQHYSFRLFVNRQSERSRIFKLLRFQYPLNERIASKTHAVQLRAIAVAPIDVLMLLWPILSRTEATATAAVCCHTDATNVSIVAITKQVRMTLIVALDGNGLISVIDPVRSSTSAPHPGNVDHSKKQMVVNTMELNL